MQRIAVIDIGSNSARLVVMELYETGAYNLVYNQKEPLRLASKINKKGEITEEGCNETVECLRNFASLCKLYAANAIIAVATAAIRNAPNGKALANRIRMETGLKVEVISGNTEAYMSYLGVVNTLAVKDALIFDLGGGSTELILVKNRKMLKSISLPIGCVNLTALAKIEDKITPAVVTRLHKIIASYASKVPWLEEAKGLPIIGVGGTARSIGKIDQKRIKYYTPKIHNYQMNITSLRLIFKMLRGTTLEERKNISGLSADRADIIVAGASIIKVLAEQVKTKQFVVSGCGLREGLFTEYYTRKTHRPLISKDILTTSTELTMTLYASDIQHNHLVAKYALELFDSWGPMLKLDKSWRPLVKTAALLHDIGITINYYSHARHSGYMIENAKIFGLTHWEIICTAIMAAWHNGISRSYMRSKAYKNLLPEKLYTDLGKGALLLSIAESLDYSQTGPLTAMHASMSKKGAVLNLTSPILPSIELHQLKIVGKWFKKSFKKDLIIKIHQ